MIKYRSKKEEREFNSPDFCPVLFRKIHVMAGVAERAFGIDIFITSVRRKDNSSHDPKNSNDGRIRAVDIRVQNPHTLKRTITKKQLRELKEYHDVRLKKYGPYDSFFEHDVGRGPHIHSQTPKNLIITLK
jgi:hypothetical protein